MCAPCKGKSLCLLYTFALTGRSYVCLPPTQGAASLALGYGIAGLSARGSRKHSSARGSRKHCSASIGSCLDEDTKKTAKTLHCRSALNIKHKTQNTTHSCRVFSEKTGSCGGRNLERKRGGSELRKAEKIAVMTWSDRGDAAIGIL